MAEVRHRGRSFERVRASIAAQVQYNRFYLFAVHCIFPKQLQNFFTSPLSCAEAHLATSPISPAAGPGRDVAANGSFRLGSRSFAPLLRSSSLPTRTSQRPLETLPANPTRPLSFGACVPVFRPTLR